jgi:hypothetical protein
MNLTLCGVNVRHTRVDKNTFLYKRAQTLIKFLSYTDNSHRLFDVSVLQEIFLC